MFVEDMPDVARARLVTVAVDAKLIEAAKLLTSGIDIVVALGRDGALQGVVTKTDVVRQISRARHATLRSPRS